MRFSDWIFAHRWRPIAMGAASLACIAGGAWLLFTSSLPARPGQDEIVLSTPGVAAPLPGPSKLLVPASAARLEPLRIRWMPASCVRKGEGPAGLCACDAADLPAGCYVSALRLVQDDSSAMTLWITYTRGDASPRSTVAESM